VRGAQLGPLAGLPVIIKDNVNTLGFPTTAGTRFLKDYRPKANAPLADMIFKQGAILFAKANMHELTLGGTSANPNFGFVKNPYDLTHSKAEYMTAPERFAESHILFPCTAGALHTCPQRRRPPPAGTAAHWGTAVAAAGRSV
jgi:Amidase